MDFLTPTRALIFYALCLLLPHAIIHWFSYRMTTWKVTGGARRVLQENILRKYFYQDESTPFPSETLFMEVFGHDVGDLVFNGYNQVFLVAKCLGRLILSLGVSALFAWEAKSSKGLDVVFLAFLPFVVQPIAVVVIIGLRWSRHDKLQHSIQSTYDGLLYKADRTLECYRMVADYFTTHLVVEDCNQDINMVNANMAALDGVMANSFALAEWVNKLLRLVWILVGGFNVAQGYHAEHEGVKFGVSLGTFVAVLSLLDSNGQQFESIFNVCMTISTTYPALWRVVTMMNLPSDFTRRQQNLQFRIQMTKDMLKVAKANHPDADFPIDEVPLVLDNVSFEYEHHTGLPEASYQLSTLSCSIKQGSAVCFMGKHGTGKATLLRILGDVLPQYEGTVFIPSHLRVQHVTDGYVLWPGTVAENLFFGECAVHDLLTDQYHKLYEGTLKRGLAICKALHFPSELQKEAENLNSKREIDSLHLTSSTWLGLS